MKCAHCEKTKNDLFGVRVSVSLLAEKWCRNCLEREMVQVCEECSYRAAPSYYYEITQGTQTKVVCAGCIIHWAKTTTNLNLVLDEILN